MSSDKRLVIAARIREARVEAGLTQRDVADHLGLHRPSVTLIESGERDVSAVETIKIAKLLKVNILWLLDEQAQDES